jgi:hypothetical protein
LKEPLKDKKHKSQEEEQGKEQSKDYEQNTQKAATATILFGHRLTFHDQFQPT